LAASNHIKASEHLFKYPSRSATYHHILLLEHFAGTLRYYLSRTDRQLGQINI
jgi:hypothetical protein